jgi:hypothetical protein
MTSPSAQSRNRKRPRPSSTRDTDHLTRPQPSAEDNSHLQAVVRATRGSTTRSIPLDLVQNTAEYLGRVTDLLSFRGVSTAWQSAVCDALGYLNDRCWTRFELGKCDGALWTSLRVDDPSVVARCAVLCLRPRLETVEWIGKHNNNIYNSNINNNNVNVNINDFLLPLQLLGENNTTLTALNLAADKFVDTAHLRELRGLKWLRLHVPNLKVSVLRIVGTLHTLEVLDLTSHPVTDLKVLRGLMALRELTLRSTPVTDRYFAGLKHVLARLYKLDLSGCRKLTTISNLAPCVSLRELNLAWSGVEDLQGLEKLVALETLDVTGIPAGDWSVLRQCPRLVALTAEDQWRRLLDKKFKRWWTAQRTVLCVPSGDRRHVRPTRNPSNAHSVGEAGKKGLPALCGPTGAGPLRHRCEQRVDPRYRRDTGAAGPQPELQSNRRCSRSGWVPRPTRPVFERHAGDR